MQMNLSMTETESQTYRRDWWLPGEKGWRGKVGSLGLADAKLHAEWINNKVLLYSTGNYIRYPVINHTGKGFEEECIQVLTSLSSCSFSLLLPSLGPHFLWPPAWSPCLQFSPLPIWLMGLLYQRNNCNHINCLSKNLCWDLVCTEWNPNCLASHFKAFYTIILADLLPFP